MIFPKKMKFKEPKNTDAIYWTQHVKDKMRFYNLSEGRLKRVLRRPEREEKGIALRTVAVMQTAGTKKNPTEVWLMYQIVPLNSKSPISNFQSPKQRIKIISAWRYPGQSPTGEPPIPEDVLRILEHGQTIIS